ncbi:MAG: tRNA (guanosine(37)-N1)-methyltransferase TrmD [Chitinivibrionales bacterium]|nr:tRNA (guanosine(37)-N1)-methyltransferase TrmD [Chitinivibrionales bacterium]
MFFEILTLFPSMFDGVFSDSILKRALDKGAITINIENIRNYAHDRHKTVDDYPYGGSSGMVLKPEPLAGAIRASKKKQETRSPLVVFFTPQGERLTHELCRKFTRKQAIILLCGRYKGIDQRIRNTYVDREISIGDFVLSGGEIPAMVFIDAITRLLPGVLGNEISPTEDSHYNGLLGMPHYTRPEEFGGMKVPEVLLSGNHAKIREWQEEQARELTRRKRKDLWTRFHEEKDEE